MFPKNSKRQIIHLCNMKNKLSCRMQILLPVNAVAKCLPPKVLEFYAPNSGGCTSTTVQTPLNKVSESNMLTSSSTLKPPQPNPFSQGIYISAYNYSCEFRVRSSNKYSVTMPLCELFPTIGWLQ